MQSSILKHVFCNRSAKSDSKALVRDYITCIEQSLESKNRLHNHIIKQHDQIDGAEFLNDPRMIGFVKELFNYYFSVDVYGVHRNNLTILSSGTVNEQTLPTPGLIKTCNIHALDMGWYGYSDSCGRNASRKALASLENVKCGHQIYDLEHVSLTLGGTSAISTIADMISMNATSAVEAIAAIPNYPPLVVSLQRRMPVRLVPLNSTPDGTVSLDAVINAANNSTRIILLQTVINPWGLSVCEDKLSQLMDKAPNATLVLDESHECHGMTHSVPPTRKHDRIVRVLSLSKLLSIPGMKLGYVLGSKDFINQFHDYASTHYGSPASIHYLAQELFGWFEAWRLSAFQELEERHLSQIDSVTPWSNEELRTLYLDYCREIEGRDRYIRLSRRTVIERFNAEGSACITPSHSVNVYAEIEPAEDSYQSFRSIINRTGVSVYPGVLCFDFERSWSRVSPVIGQPTLQRALNLLYADRRDLRKTVPEQVL